MLKLHVVAASMAQCMRVIPFFVVVVVFLLLFVFFFLAHASNLCRTDCDSAEDCGPGPGTRIVPTPTVCRV